MYNARAGLLLEAHGPARGHCHGDRAGRSEAGARASGEPGRAAPPRPAVRPPPPAPGKAESIAILNTCLQLGGNSRWKRVFNV